MRVLAIDESLAKTAWVVIEDGILLDIKSVEFRGYKSKTKIRLEIYHYTKELAKLFHIDKIVVERIGVRGGWRSVQTMIELGALVKFIVMAGVSLGVPVESVDTRHWKSSATGSSTISKADTIKWANALIKEQGYLRPVIMADSLVRDEDWYHCTEDEADAIGIGIAACKPKALLKIEE